ncbi:DNRLRE domain-containing protein [Nonomuraea sp. NPDC003201]
MDKYRLPSYRTAHLQRLAAFGAALLTILSLTHVPSARAAPIPDTSAQLTQPVELLGYASEDRRVIRRPDGTFTLEEWARPVRVKRSDAQWAWIDTTLVEQNGTLTPKVAKATTEISAGGADKPLARLTVSSDESFTLGWPGDLPKPTVKGSTAVYPNAAGPQADLAVTALATGFRYEIILRARPSKVTEFTFPLQANGLKLAPTKRSALEGTDSKGRLAAIAGKAFMKGVKRGQPARRIAAEVIDSSNGQALVVKPDAGYLADSTTIYPVTISSTVGLPLTKEADVADDGVPADPSRPLMTAGSIFGITNRIYLRFNADAVIGQDIIDAKLSLLNTDAPGCGDVVGDGIQVREVTGAWDQDNLTWDNKPATSATHAQTSTAAYNGAECDPAALEWSVTPIVQNWASGSPNWGLALQSPSETSGDDNWRTFASSEHDSADYPPKLTITGRSAPEPTVLYPAGPDGVEVFTVSGRWRGDSIQLGDTSSAALDMAQTRTDEHSDLLARPYVDRVTGDLVAPATTAGRDTARQLLSGVASARGLVDATLAGSGFEDEDAPSAKGAIAPPATTDFRVTPRVVEVANSAQQLNEILDAALEPASGLPEEAAIFAGNIWDERNLAIVQSTSASPELRRALADRYGVNNVAIWLRTEEDWVSTTGQRSAGTASTSMATDSRQNDIGKLNGNSHFTSLNGDGTQSNCTTAFAWGTETDNLFMTAGHCVDAKSFTFGDVVWTNWKKGVGTVGLPGDTTTYGDLALLKVGHPPANPRAGTTAMFFGPVDTTIKHWVIGRDPVRSKVGDQYCVGGATTGDSCSWKVVHLGWKIKYYDKDGNYRGRIRWADEGQSIHACKEDGDSGGAVYNFAKGGVIAKGITSGANTTKYTPSADKPCTHTYTDIADAVRASGYEIRKH